MSALQLMMARARMNHVSTGGDPYWDKVVYALHFDGADGSTDFVDEKGNTWVSEHDAQLSTDQAKFGSASLSLDASSTSRIYTTALGYDFGDGDFSIGMWVWPKSLPTGSNIVALASARVPDRWQFSLRNNSIAFTAWNTSGSAFSNFGSDTITIATETWHHIATARSGDNWYLFFDGMLVGSTSASGSIHAGTGALRIGADPTSSTRYLDAYVDDFEVTKGAARWTDDFTVPTAPFPNHG